ncbi:hypothetical protein KR51_00013170 [Rubidibacter lacunae KORDI 51-2]|uniref:Uncharacterized protein n=1 Tax=Rubidibacter lacunae KORDI 51-2 TaxID=582515 RepID=U5DJX0_9CHRO|nr:hypothetical protein KR51_00013170 [Rubidibacter lacunae KORDI 51-2]
MMKTTDPPCLPSTLRRFGDPFSLCEIARPLSLKLAVVSVEVLSDRLSSLEAPPHAVAERYAIGEVAAQI